MAESLNSIRMPRRALLAGAAGLAAVPVFSPPAKADPVFAEKLAQFWKARSDYRAALADVDLKLAALGPRPADSSGDWLATARKIESGTTTYLHAEDSAAIAVIRHPVFTLAEVRQKIRVAEETYIFGHDDGDELRDCILRDALVIAELAHA